MSKGKYWALVDDADYEIVAKYEWFLEINRNGRRVKYAQAYMLKDEKIIRVKMHRFIMDAPKESIIDHKNGDGLDNQKTNLRFCTHSQNIANIRIRSDNTLGYKGLENHKNSPKPWRARIRTKGKRFHLGYFSTPEEAARAYDRKAKELFGEFASPNFT